MTNETIAELLSQFADLLDIKGENGFRVSAYRRGADTIRRLDEPIETLSAEGRLTDVKGIGKGLAGNISDILEDGRFAELEQLQDEVPATLLTILAIPGVGPKTVGRFYRELGITNLEELEATAEEDRLTSLKGIGKKQVDRIVEGIAFLRQRTGRASIGAALPVARTVSRAIEESLDARAEIVGSLRRYAETVGNIDLQMTGASLEAVRDLLETEFEAQDLNISESSVLTGRLPRTCDFRVFLTNADRWGTDLIRFTGSAGHVEALTSLQEKEQADEVDAYTALGLRWIPPEMREARGEIELAGQGRLPDLLSLSDIKGDLHLHSTWSDGRASIRELAERAVELGYEYLSIADHSHSLAIANGLNEERLRSQWEEIADVQSHVPSLRLFRASEVEIRRDGTLDFEDDVLSELDLVVASLHSGRSMTREDITNRLLNAIENPHVDIIAHPTGRIVEQRPPAEYDWERVFEAAARTKTVLEINANPARLDLPEELAAQAVEAGAIIAINSDAHNLRGLDVMEFGVGIARRAWLEAGSVINTWSRDEVLAWLGR
jgi:DNA polymerase (family X)